MEKRILLSEHNRTLCPKTPVQVAEAIERFRNSDLKQYTYQVRRGDPNAPLAQMGFDFPIDKMRELVNNPDCQKIRVLFSIDDGELAQDGYLSVVLIGVNNNQLLIDTATIMDCCGEPPTT